MKTMIILDTNIISSKNPARLRTLKENISSYREIGDVYITETVLDESSVHYYRFLEEIILPSLENYTFIYKSIGLDYDFLEIHKKQPFESIRKFISNLFEDNIIPLNLDSIKIDFIYKRALRKEAPFTSPKKEGDSGFKDTLIWLTILNYNYESFDEIIFVTSDTDFKNSRDNLQKIFGERHGKNLKIYDEKWSQNKENLKEKNYNKETDVVIHKAEDNGKKTDDIDQLLEDYEKISVFRKKLEEILDDIVLIPINPFENYENDPFKESFNDLEDYRFRINEYVNIKDFLSLKNHLFKIILENGLLSGIGAEQFLSLYINKQAIVEIHRINTDSLKELLETMNNFEKALPNYTDAFLSFINDKINTITYSPPATDLPF